MAEKLEPAAGDSGRNPQRPAGGVSNATAATDETRPDTSQLMETVVEKENMRKAYHRVVSNKGSAGIDEMSVEELGAHLKEHWAEIRKQLLEGTYKPQAVRRVEIPKPGKKGTRQLGIPPVRTPVPAGLPGVRFVPVGIRSSIPRSRVRIPDSAPVAVPAGSVCPQP